MATVADIQTQLSTLQTTVNEIAAKPPVPAPVATQADLDSISASLATAQTGLDAIKSA